MSAHALVSAALEAAARRGELGAFWALDREGALAAASAIDAGPDAPPVNGLEGTPVAIKDLFDQAGLPTSAGLAGPHAVADSDAEAVSRLRRAGAVPVGKTAMDALAFTTGGQAPGFPPCINPVDAALSPGGSSSGSAVAVAAGIVPLALASDTAGSARIPAAYCGVVGLKPTLGAIPRDGCVPVMPGFDTVSLVGDSVDRCAHGLAALTGGETGGGPPRRPLRVGILVDLLERADSRVAGCSTDVLRRLEPTDATVEEVRLDWSPQGLGQALAHELATTWGERVDSDPGRFTELIRGTVEFGRTVTTERYDATLADLAAARDDLGRRFAEFDALACPTVPIPAPVREDESVKVSSSFTRIFNALDWPAISVPLVPPAGVSPIALQLAGVPSRLDAVLQAARLVEQAVQRDSAGWPYDHPEEE